jgi:hypothetical protein
MGLVNEPGFKPAEKPDQYGLWLDERVEPEPESIDTKVYGHASGIMGLRLFPNPAFNEEAQKKWNPEKFYSDPNYYNDPRLVRPYMVGMSCGFCHISFNPVKPPADPENPKRENLSSYIGNQYFRAANVFGNAMGEDSYVYQVLQSARPGSLDTSFIATDNINNPNVINGIFNAAARLSRATEERLAGSSLVFSDGKDTMPVPHILKDGADSVGLPGALGRVFVNIGEYHEEWLKCFNPLIGGKPQRPLDVRKARQESPYWQATEGRLENLAKFFLKAARPMPLADAPGGKAYLTQDQDILTRGKLVFAEHCASCHSSKLPPANLTASSAEYTAWLRQEVLKPDFVDNNFLSDDQRYPVSEIKTNACRALGTNAMRGHVWDNFSSETYKTLPSVGPIEVYNPFSGKTSKFQTPSGGPGYYRTPTLVSIWSSAPFFHNNALGEYTGDPSVAGRIKAFDDAVQKLLWPEKRLGVESVFRTTADSYIQVPTPYLPRFLRALGGKDGYLSIGPIPAGTPINVLASVDVTLSSPRRIARLVKVAKKVKLDLLQIRLRRLNAEQRKKVLSNLVPDLLSLSKCPDFIEDRGHYYGTNVPDADKLALIEFLKTL